MAKIHKIPKNNNGKNTKYQRITIAKIHNIPNNNNDKIHKIPNNNHDTNTQNTSQ
jgi:hypothetical protein